MQIKNAHILEAREHNNKTYLCLIRVLPRNLDYYYGQTRPYRTYRWMQAEHWAAFDAGLEAILNSNDFPNANVNSEEQFMLNKLIQVRLKTSRIPTQTLCGCISVGNSELNAKDVALAVECIVEYRANGKWKEKPEKITVEEIGKNEYEPQPVSIKSGNGVGLLASSASSYVPYTPSAKQSTSTAETGVTETSGVAFLNRQSEEEYTPVIVSDSSPDKISHTPSPVYNAARILNRRRAMTEQPRTLSDGDEEEEDKEGLRFKEFKSNRGKRDKEKMYKKENTNEKDEKSKEKAKSSKDKPERKKDKYIEIATALRHDDKEAGNSKGYREAAKSDQRSGQIDEDDNFMSTYGAKYVSSSDHNKNSDTDTNEPRRSSRSPLKTKRLIDEKLNACKHPSENGTKRRRKSKSPTTKKIKETKTVKLFGEDDDDDDDEYVPKCLGKETLKTTPINVHKRHQTDATRSLTKRKRAGDCDKEKHSMNTWLTKKKDSSSSSTPPLLPTECGTKKGRSQSSSRTTNALAAKTKRKDNKLDSRAAALGAGHLAAYPSFEEMEKQMCEAKIEIENNRKLNAQLKEIAGPPPAKFETLTLFDMDSVAILDSYLVHKSKLDEIFEKLRKKSNVRGYDGIDHFLVMGLVDQNMQLLMLQKLCDIYSSNNEEASSVYTKLFTNAMMPEWIILLYMDKYKFTRDDAIKQVKGQEEYRLHLEAEAQSDSFILI